MRRRWRTTRDTGGSTFEPLEPRLLLATGPIISELLAANASVLADVDGEYSDWIEIHNPTSAAIDLTGWHLTDTKSNLSRWTFPAVSLDSGEYRVVFASGKNRLDPAGELHTNFALDADNGEYLALVGPGATVDDVVHEYDPFPEQFDDVSYGLIQHVTPLVSEGAEVAYHVPTAGDAALGTGWAEAAYDDSAWTATVPAPQLRITEAAIGVPDYVEIQNVSQVPIDATGWAVAVNHAQNGNINDMHATTWSLTGTIAPGEVLYRTDNSGDNYWGENIYWQNTAGQGWVLIIDEEGEVVDFVVWGYTTSEIDSMSVNVNGFTVTGREAWSGDPVAAVGDSSHSLQRAGIADHDSAADFSWVTPLSKGVTNTSLTVPFPPAEGGASTTGVGFSTHGVAFTVTNYKANITVNTVTVAEGVIATPAQQSWVAIENADVVSYENTYLGGHYLAGHAPFPGTTIGVPADDFVVEVTGAVIIPTAGQWTFGVMSDDGFSLELTNGAETFTTSFPTVRSPSDTLAVFDVTTPGVYDLRLVYFERGGGSSLELFAAEGGYAVFDSDAFRLVGDAAGGGVAVCGFEGAIRTDVEDEMHDVNASLWTRIPFQVDDLAGLSALTLKMRYDDGFAAYLNGRKIAQQNAPPSPQWDSAATAERSHNDSAVFEEFNVTEYIGLLEVGTNVLAVHGLNVAADDADLLVLPELIASGTGTVVERYFTTPSPGAANSAGFVYYVGEPQFSVDHGFFEDPFHLALSTATAGATIRYTTDGSEPTETSGTVYAAPILIDATSIIRAGAYRDGFEPNTVRTRTYIFLADVVTQSASGAAPAGWPSGSVNGQVLDYGMDPDIVNNATWGPQLIDALTDIPTMSIVTDVGNLFDPATGIYVNATYRGVEWERASSLELINPDGSEGFQVNMGLRIRGGYSRSDANPKHAFRLFFREEYGDAKLEFPLFEDEGVDEFDKIDLRTSQNYSWSYHGDVRNAMVRDVFARDTQAEMGQPYTRSRYYHLYINGQYWGLYQTQERSEAAYGESYLGGDREDYDVVKCTGSPAYATEATDGSLDAWQDLWEQAVAGLGTDAAYAKAQGLNPDGTRNPDYDVLLDVDNLIDYMIVIFYSGNLDAPISNFLGNNRPNNWYGIRDRTGDQGFQFFAHDSEHTLLVGDLNEDRTGPWPAGQTFQYSNPQWIHQQLMANQQYLVRFGDRVGELFFDGGLLSPEAATQRFLDRAAEIDMAIIAESARWGDSKVATPRTKQDWQDTINDTVANYFPQRTGIVLSQFKATTLSGGASAPLYPSVDAPTFNQDGGHVDPGFNLLMTAPAGVVYYTTDGSDPRQPDGTVNPAAEIFDDAVTTDTLVATGSDWYYLDDGSDQTNTDWNEPGYVPTGWGEGPAQLGYGGNGEVTTVSFGGDAANKYITTYFRQTFTAADVAEIATLTLRIVRDDGAVVYINGDEVRRPNMPSGAEIDHLTPASSTVGGAAETTFYDFDIDPAFLVEGTNVIAVEIHQSVVNSSDISFDLELKAVFAAGDPLVLDESVVIKARAHDGGVWSALNEAGFHVGDTAAAGNFAVTEINYHPHEPTPEELAVDSEFVNGDFEFIEFQNTGDGPIDLTDLTFTDGITFDFNDANVSSLEGGQYVVLAANPIAFAVRYPGVTINGHFTGSLSNGGERLVLANWLGDDVFDFEYDDSGSWPGRADGKGSTLEVIDPTQPLYDDDNWRSSVEYGGTPGHAGSPYYRDVVVNEILAAPLAPDVDAIELYNTTGQPIDIGGWYLTDSNANGEYRKFRIPDYTTLGAQKYIVFDETDFNSSGGSDPADFSLDADGEEVWLLEADDEDRLIRFADHVEFDESVPGLPFGRWPNGSGSVVWLSALTLNAVNAKPLIKPVVINEIHIDPDVKVEPVEYIELYNSGDEPVDVSGWYFADGVDYTIPADTFIGVDGYLIVSQDPTALQAKFGVASLGPFVGKLSNDGEDLVLRDAAGHRQDAIDYNLGFPWPTVGDAPGYSVQLIHPSFDNDLGGNWRGAAPTPGAVNAVFADNAAPQMRQVDHSPNQPDPGQDVTITVKATDPEGVASVTLQYQLVDPGDYISLTDARYATQWTDVVMVDDGTGGDDNAGDGVYTAVIPGHLQTHRRLVRYRIIAEDALGLSITGPYTDDPQPNFAYYVYGSVPAWTGSDRPGVEPELTYGSDLLESLPIYQLITTRQSHERSQYIPDSDQASYPGSDYPWAGALVYGGVVYDHIHYRARGGGWRYAMGKNMWKFDFTRGHSFQAYDDYGQPYDTTWDKVNFSAAIQQGDYLHRGEQGLFESVGFKLFELTGVEAPVTDFAHFRIVESADEFGANQFSDDFQGLYLAMEQMDGNFLDQHGLPDGNLYKMESGTGMLNNQGPTQPTNKSDLSSFMSTYDSSPGEQWFRDNVELEKYYSYRSIVEGIHHYDIGYGKNYFYYHDPVTGKWSVLPWDLDLTWANNMYGNGNEPFKTRVLSLGVFAQEYRNRMREIKDLLYNPEQTGMLIDEMASFIYTAGELSFVDADRAMWDYNPILSSGYVDSRKAGHGRFYESAPTDDFAGMVQLMKNYVVSRGAWIDTNILTDEASLPDTPTVSYTGFPDFPIDALAFESSAFGSASSTFAAMEWRIARVTDPADPGFVPTDPRYYEIEADWESGELDTFDDTVEIPGQGFVPGAIYRVRVRMKDAAGRWSHWSDAEQFVAGDPVGNLPDQLRVTEIMYNPPEPTAAELAVNPDFKAGDFEFIELKNVSDEAIDVTGAIFTKGITFTFGATPPIDPGEFIVVVSNTVAFEARYGPDAATRIHIAGAYTGSLDDDGGERIKYEDTFARTIQDFDYGVGGGWPGRADGKGSSLEAIATNGDYNDDDNWRSSAEYHGSPGSDGSGPIGLDIVLNEVLSHTDEPQTDSIELLNVSGQTWDISGWFLSDTSDNYQKFRIPDDTVLESGDYVVFNEGHFNTSGGVDPDDFALDGAHGDDVWLVAADTAGDITRFVDHVEFGAADNGESFGRWPNGTGDLYPMDPLTLAGVNLAPRIGPLVVSEICYDPTTGSDSDLEFIEIYNSTGETVYLTNWRIRGGIEFDFADATPIAPHATLVVIPFDPADPSNAAELAAFRSAHGIDDTVPLFGGYSGRLSNDGETVQLLRPDDPPAGETEHPYLLEDEVDYAVGSPWPGSPTSGDHSIHRLGPDRWGNDPASWLAAETSPGNANLAPVAVDDDYATTPNQQLDVPAAAGVLANDIDYEGDPITAHLVTDVAHGDLTLLTDGSFVYIPDTDYAGPDSFAYRANDTHNDSAPATVHLIVETGQTPMIGVIDNSGLARDAAVQFTTALSQFRPGASDSALIRPTYGDTKHYVDVVNVGEVDVILQDIQINAPDVTVDETLTVEIVLAPSESQRFQLTFAPTLPTISNSDNRSFDLSDGLVIFSNAAALSVTLRGVSTFMSDINYDGSVNLGELGVLNANFGEVAADPGFDPTADIDGDGFINLADLGPLNAQLGRAIPLGTSAPSGENSPSAGAAAAAPATQTTEPLAAEPPSTAAATDDTPVSAVLGPIEPPTLFTAVADVPTTTEPASTAATSPSQTALTPATPTPGFRTIRITRTTDLGLSPQTRAGRLRRTADHDVLLSDALYYALKLESPLASPAIRFDALD